MLFANNNSLLSITRPLLILVCAVGVLPDPGVAQRVILDEDFDDDTPDALPDTVDFFARSSVAPDPDLDPSTAVVTGGAFADPFNPGNNQSLVLHNPDGTTQMAVTWTDEFMDDPSTFRNGTIDFDLYMETPDPAAFWTFLGVRVGHGDEDRSGVATAPPNGVDVTVWNSFRLQNVEGNLLEQMADHGAAFTTVGQVTTFTDNGDDLIAPDQSIHVQYTFDGTGTTPQDPPTYQVIVSGTPVQWVQDSADTHPWSANLGTFQIAPGANILSFLTDASAGSMGTGNVYLDNLVVVNNDLAPLGNGDYNGDGMVNAADYTIWRDTLGSTTDLRANGDDSGASQGVIDQADYDAWVAQFGNAVPLGAGASIPEPSAALLLLAAGTVVAGTRRRV